MDTKQKSEKGLRPKRLRVWKMGIRWGMIFIILFVALSTASAQDWPMFQHDPQHTGYTNSSAPMGPNDVGKDLKLLTTV